MPRASEELRAKFPNGDEDAFRVLKVNFALTRGGIIYPVAEGYKPTPEERDAIHYLVYEWDYGYDPRVMKKRLEGIDIE
jgi:hypothetical protein